MGKAADGGDVDLVVTNTSEYTPLSPAANTLSEGFGQINVATGTSVALRFALVATGTNTPVTAARLDFSLFDFDKGSGTSEREETMVPSSSYSAYTVDLDSQLHVMADAVTTTVRATKQSSSANIDDPKALDAEERARTIQFTFRDVVVGDDFKVAEALGGGGGLLSFSGASMALPKCPPPPLPPMPPPSPPRRRCRRCRRARRRRRRCARRRRACSTARTSTAKDSFSPGGAPRSKCEAAPIPPTANGTDSTTRRRRRRRRCRPRRRRRRSPLPKPSVLTAEAACCRGKYGRGLLGGADRRPAVRRQPDRRRRGPFLALRAVFSVPSGSQPPLFFRFYVERSAKSADGERELIVTDARPDQAGCMSNCSLTAEGFDAGTYEVRVMAVTPSGETAISDAMGLTLGKDELARCAPGGPTPKPPTPATSALEPMPLRLRSTTKFPSRAT